MFFGSSMAIFFTVTLLPKVKSGVFSLQLFMIMGDALSWPGVILYPMIVKSSPNATVLVITYFPSPIYNGFFVCL